MISDEQLAKFASEKNFTPLTSAFNVKLADARNMLEEVKLRAFVTKMAEYGFAPNSEEELEQLVQTGQLVEAKLAAEKAEMERADVGLYKAASDRLRSSLGVNAPTETAATQQAMYNAADKVAAYAVDPTVIMHMLALAEAEAVEQAA